MNELFYTYNDKVTELLAQLSADLVSRSAPITTEWKQAVTSIQQNLAQMGELNAEQLNSALIHQRERLARLGELYLCLSRPADFD